MTSLAYSTPARKKALIDAQLSGAEIARACHVSEALVSRVLKGERIMGPKAREVMHFIAGRVGIPASILFPGSEAA